MEFITERLIIRPWEKEDAQSLYEYAKSPEVGPIAGWPVHTSVQNSLEIIEGVLAADETYAVCLKEDNRAIGSIGLITPAQSHTKTAESEMEVGYWIGVPFWGKGYIPEAVKRIQKHAFEDLGCTALWCGYYDGNERSKRCQEKCGFTYHHTEENKPCTLMGDVRTEHFTYLTKEHWENNFNSITICRERKEEQREVENLIRESFWNVYRPGCLEHYVIHVLRNDTAFVPELNFVMEKDKKIIGQNMFMRAVIKSDDKRDIPIMTMGPICITPELKRKGYGKILLDYSLEKAKEAGCGAVCFEGNIDFYGKSGFTYARNFGIRYHGLPDGGDDSFFLCKELIKGYLDGITGEYETPAGYFVDETEAMEFDRQFLPKEKLKLPGQIFG